MHSVPPRAPDEKFCSSCGQPIKKDAVVCVKCGAQVELLKHQDHVVVAQHPTEPKDKAVAVVLAIFFGFWAWIYTYQKDAWKFWLNLVLGFFTFGIMWLVGWLWAVIDTAVKPASYYERFPN